ncbi:MAG: hypothetical protein LBC68_11920 [Prevotellaceae bacterium]|jgi:hypothetical protein|nr:hypothetical protein [Prevotellaceae bacterium]
MDCFTLLVRNDDIKRGCPKNRGSLFLYQLFDVAKDATLSGGKNLIGYRKTY